MSSLKFFIAYIVKNTRKISSLVDDSRGFALSQFNISLFAVLACKDEIIQNSLPTVVVRKLLIIYLTGPQSSLLICAKFSRLSSTPSHERIIDVIVVVCLYYILTSYDVRFFRVHKRIRQSLNNFRSRYDAFLTILFFAEFNQYFTEIFTRSERSA